MKRLIVALGLLFFTTGCATQNATNKSNLENIMLPAQPVVLSVSNPPTDIVIKKIGKTIEEQKLMTALRVSYGVLTPEYETIKPKTGNIFIIVEFEIINRSDTKIQPFKDKKIVVNDSQGNRIPHGIRGKKSTEYLPFGAWVPEIEAYGRLSDEAFLAEVKEDIQNITIEYAEESSVLISLVQHKPDEKTTSKSKPFSEKPFAIKDDKFIDRSFPHGRIAPPSTVGLEASRNELWVKAFSEEEWILGWVTPFASFTTKGKSPWRVTENNPQTKDKHTL